MKSSFIHLNDLPDEILIYILKKLDNFQVLYSLIGVNDRLNKIANDSIFTNNLTLMKYLSNDSIYPLANSTLDRLCSKILPLIHNKIEWLNIESSSIKRILLVTNYPNLHGIGLYNINMKKFLSLFTDKLSLICIDKNEILSLVIDITKNKKTKFPSREDNTFVFTNIFTIFKNLKYLNFGPFLNWYQEISFIFTPPTVISSNLLELHLSVVNFLDCLYLLDGRFNKLHTFYVHISSIGFQDIKIDNKDKLPNLRCFSLHCDSIINNFEQLILTLIYRMLNLEKLELNVNISMTTTIIDGNYLKTNILNHMIQLNKFTFNIHSRFGLRNQIYFPSNENIQHTFNNFKNNKIISCIDYYPKNQYGQCHIYSYPYRLKYYKHITNNFPGGLLKYVQDIYLFDRYPFEHEFFLQISQSFPFVKKINLRNYQPQNNKLYTESNKDNQDLPIIKYPHLTDLTLNLVNDDYVEQFLLNRRTCLPNTVELIIGYEQLKRVTHNFTSNTTRINCAKLSSLCMLADEIPKYVKDYFPHTKIY
ncbi:unnamed protein product [Rotaria sp. Silwood1]|nr:unnamed protein product [Rotaria sp. Silwood1]